MLDDIWYICLCRKLDEFPSTMFIWLFGIIHKIQKLQSYFLYNQKVILVSVVVFICQNYFWQYTFLFLDFSFRFCLDIFSFNRRACDLRIYTSFANFSRVFVIFTSIQHFLRVFLWFIFNFTRTIDSQNTRKKIDIPQARKYSCDFHIKINLCFQNHKYRKKISSICVSLWVYEYLTFAISPSVSTSKCMQMSHIFTMVVLSSYNNNKKWHDPFDLYKV